MLNGALAFTGEAVLWANAPRLEQNNSAQTLMSACPTK